MKLSDFELKFINTTHACPKERCRGQGTNKLRDFGRDTKDTVALGCPLCGTLYFVSSKTSQDQPATLPAASELSSNPPETSARQVVNKPVA